MKGTEKSLPGFLAKNVDLICKWLREYTTLFQKADDACIDYLKLMERPKRDELVQDYVDIHIFFEAVKMLKNKACIASSNDVAAMQCEEDKKDKKCESANEEVLQEDMG